MAADCLPKAGGQLTQTPWPQTRLDFQRAWAITEGAGVKVAVIDTGMDRQQPQMARIKVAGGLDVLAGFRPGDTSDCDGHGTAVTGIIAAPQLGTVPFVGVAPGATIVPIKQSNTSNDNLGRRSGIARGIRYALQAGARVINISVTVPSPGADLDAAVAAAARANVVIVAAAGNDGSGVNATAYPAAYSLKYDNVIAVSATDSSDAVPQFSESGHYVTLCAPGVGVLAPARQSGYTKLDGTSFAAPFVTGTVALMLSAHPAMSAAAVRDRLEATADPPPVAVPDPKYGYGVVNPYLAVTSVRDDTLAAPVTRVGKPLPAPVVARPEDRRLQHIALASALCLLALALLAAAGTAVLRRPQRSAQ
ncbi:MAG: S8 family serine peptidase [Jatrophihabitantaceae bacterium]